MIFIHQVNATIASKNLFPNTIASHLNVFFRGKPAPRVHPTGSCAHLGHFHGERHSTIRTLKGIGVDGAKGSHIGLHRWRILGR